MAFPPGLVPGDFVFLHFGLVNEEHVNVISLDTVNQTLTAIRPGIIRQDQASSH
jgi:hypothetical protein